MSVEAPLVFVRVGRADEVAEGQVREYKIGTTTLAVCRRGGTHYALDGVCSHAQGPLAQGELDGNFLVCPWHGWEYNIATGACEIEPSLCQRTFAVKVEGGELLVALPPDPA